MYSIHSYPALPFSTLQGLKTESSDRPRVPATTALPRQWLREQSTFGTLLSQNTGNGVVHLALHVQAFWKASILNHSPLFLFPSHIDTGMHCTDACIYPYSTYMYSTHMKNLRWHWLLYHQHARPTYMHIHCYTHVSVCKHTLLHARVHACHYIPDHVCKLVTYNVL